MKASKIPFGAVKSLLFWSAIVVAVGFQCLDSSQSLVFSPTIQFGCDLCLRRNEIVCAHRGVNSFRVWNRDIALEGFVPMERYDKPDIDRGGGGLLVHNYPAWHTAMFYFFGWMPERMCVSFMSILFGVCLVFIWRECFRVSRARFPLFANRVAILSLVMVASYMLTSLFVLQYAVLLLALMLMMNRSVEKGNEILVGLAWGLMLIKPQIGVLFFWPLLWGRHFLAIAVAAVFVLAATGVTSVLVNESVIDLLLQVPQIGKPYAHGYVCDSLLNPYLGEISTLVCPLAFFILTGVACYLIRKNRDFLFNCLPVVVAIPWWTYSQSYDWGVLVVFYVFFFGSMMSAVRIDKWLVFGLISVFLTAFMLLWQIFTRLQLFNPCGIGWIYRCVQIPFWLALACFFAMYLYENRNGFVDLNRNRQPCLLPASRRPRG